MSAFRKRGDAAAGVRIHLQLSVRKVSFAVKCDIHLENISANVDTVS